VRAILEGNGTLTAFRGYGRTGRPGVCPRVVNVVAEVDRRQSGSMKRPSQPFTRGASGVRGRGPSSE